MSRKTVIVWDLDGTLADGKHRLHLLPTKDHNKTEAWRPFNLASCDDAPIWDNIELLRAQATVGFHIVILTGRSDEAMQMTKEWLARYYVPYNRLIMRGQDDNRTDIEFKGDRLRQIGLHNILCAFDDLEHVVKSFRKLGITCHQVTHYEDHEKHAHVKSQEENERDSK